MTDVSLEQLQGHKGREKGYGKFRNRWQNAGGKRRKNHFRSSKGHWDSNSTFVLYELGGNWI